MAPKKKGLSEEDKDAAIKLAMATVDGRIALAYAFEYTNDTTIQDLIGFVFDNQCPKCGGLIEMEVFVAGECPDCGNSYFWNKDLLDVKQDFLVWEED